MWLISISTNNYPIGGAVQCSSTAMQTIFASKLYALSLPKLVSSECRSRPDRACVEVERCPGGGSTSSDALHERGPHVLRRLPVPLPLVDEPIVDLLRVQPSHRSQPYLILFLQNATVSNTIPKILTSEQRWSQIWHLGKERSKMCVVRMLP